MATSDVLVMGKLRKFGILNLLDLPDVSDIAINRPGEIWWLTSSDGWQKKDVPELTFQEAEALAIALAAYHGRGLKFNSPVKTVELPISGVRGLLVIPPACEQGTVSITLRKPSLQRFTLNDYIDSGRFSKVNVREKISTELVEWQIQLKKSVRNRDWGTVFKEAVDRRLNLIIFGGTGSGKTTLAKAIVDMYSTSRRLLTIEEVNELKLPNHPNHIHLIYGDHVSSKELVTASMRMKPDHVFLAEITGDEVWDYISLLNTGHPGSVTTCHADGTLEGFSRAAGLVKQSPIGANLSYQYILDKVKSSFDIILFMKDTEIMEVSYNPEEKLSILSNGAL